MELCQLDQVESGCANSLSPAIASLPPSLTLVYEWLFVRVNVKWGYGYLAISCQPAPINTLQ